MKKTDIWLYSLSLLYLAVLLAVLAVFGYTPGPDTDGYIAMAQKCLAEGQPYPCTATIEGTPFLWNIGSINLIEASLALTGSIAPLLIVFCLMKAATALFAAKTAQTLIGNRTAVATMLLCMLYPNNWGQSTTLLSEIPMVFFATAAVLLAVKKPSGARIAAAGVLLCIANWFRPIAVLFAFIIALYYILFFRRDALRHILMLAAGYAVTVCIIGTETWSRTGYFIYQCDSFWYNMADDAYDGATPDAHFGEPLFKKGTPRYIENMEQKNCFECSDIWRERCMEWLLSHKWEYLKKVPWRLYYMLSNDNDNAAAFIAKAEKQRPDGADALTVPYRHVFSEWHSMTFAQRMAFLCTAAYYLLVLLAIAGCVVLARRKQWEALFITAFTIVFVTLATVLMVQGEARFKAPYMPYLTILAAVGATQIVKSKKVKEEKSKKGREKTR